MQTGYATLPEHEPPVLDPMAIVHPDKLLHVVEAARWALPETGLSDVELVVVDDPQVLAELGERAAPVLLVAVYEPADVLMHAQLLGLGCVLQNLWHAANDVGLGLRVVADPAGELARVLAIPASRAVAFAVELGLPRTTPSPHPPRDLRDVVRWNRYR